MNDLILHKDGEWNEGIRDPWCIDIQLKYCYLHCRVIPVTYWLSCAASTRTYFLSCCRIISICIQCTDLLDRYKKSYINLLSLLCLSPNPHCYGKKNNIVYVWIDLYTCVCVYTCIYISIMDRDFGIILQSCNYLHHTQCALHDKSSMKLYKLEKMYSFFTYNF